MEKAFIGNFAEFIFNTHYKELPNGVIHQNERCLLDFLGVALAGGSVGLAPLITNIIYGMGGSEEATIRTERRYPY